MGVAVWGDVLFRHCTGVGSPPTGGGQLGVLGVEGALGEDEEHKA